MAESEKSVQENKKADLLKLVILLTSSSSASKFAFQFVQMRLRRHMLLAAALLQRNQALCLGLLNSRNRRTLRLQRRLYQSNKKMLQKLRKMRKESEESLKKQEELIAAEREKNNVIKNLMERLNKD